MSGLLACGVCAAADPPSSATATPPASLPQPTEATSSAGVAKLGTAAVPAGTAAPAATGPLADQVVEEVEIEAPEPRYVAPTLRDRIGRIWAPVLIDGKGPFRLVLDTGASHSAVNAWVAQTLGMPVSGPGVHLVRLRGVMGTLTVPTIHVSNFIVGDLQIDQELLPIVPDALGGASGVLGTEGLMDKRIYIDFRHDLITIKHSRGQPADNGFTTIPVRILPGHLLAVTAYVGTIKVTAIVDTGAQTSIANVALRQALLERRRHLQFTADQMIDTTDTVGEGQGADVPTIRLGRISIRSAHLTLGDVEIFKAWKLENTPAVLIGMDALGTVDALVIDYKRSELQILARGGGPGNGEEYEHPFGDFRDLRDRDPR